MSFRGGGGEGSPPLARDPVNRPDVKGLVNTKISFPRYRVVAGFRGPSGETLPVSPSGPLTSPMPSRLGHTGQNN